MISALKAILIVITFFITAPIFIAALLLLTIFFNKEAK